MNHGVFRRLLSLILGRVGRRLDDATAVARKSPHGAPEGLGDAILDIVEEGRRQAWAATVAYLRSEARGLGADEAFIPPRRPYEGRAIRETAKRFSDPYGRDWGRMRSAMQRHVITASRQAVVDAVEDAPEWVEVLDELEDLEEDLGGFPEEIKREAVREVREHSQKASEKPAAKTISGLFQDIYERLDEAAEELEHKELKEEAAPARESVAQGRDDGYRRDLEGRVIARPFAWARVVRPSENGPCGFCAMLASRGPVYKSSHSAGMRVDRYHDGCVVGDTKVSGPDVEVGYRRAYEGEVVTLVTPMGEDLTITPNHPVLTTRGWVPAGLLNKGDDLICGSFGDWYLSQRPHEDHACPSIEDVVSAIGVVGLPFGKGVPTSPQDFHGDGLGSDVHVVVGNHFLGGTVDSSTFQLFPELDLVVGNGALPLGGEGFYGSGSLEFGFDGLTGPSGGPVGGGRNGLLLLGGGAGHSDGLSLCGGSDVQPGFLESSNNSAPADSVSLGHLENALLGGVNLSEVGRGSQLLRAGAPEFGTRYDPMSLEGDPDASTVFAELGGDLLERLSGLVQTCRLLDKRVWKYSGDVYNLSTAEGWYSANSVIVSNCRCEVVGVWTSRAWPGKEDSEEYARVYNRVVKEAGLHGADARTAMDKELRGGRSSEKSAGHGKDD